MDETVDVREKGRSAVLRQLTSDFLRQRREHEIDAQYERAYAGVDDPLGKDFEGWEEEGVWRWQASFTCQAIVQGTRTRT